MCNCMFCGGEVIHPAAAQEAEHSEKNKVLAFQSFMSASFGFSVWYKPYKVHNVRRQRFGSLADGMEKIKKQNSGKIKPYY